MTDPTSTARELGVATRQRRRYSPLRRPDIPVARRSPSSAGRSDSAANSVQVHNLQLAGSSPCQRSMISDLAQKSTEGVGHPYQSDSSGRTFPFSKSLNSCSITDSSFSHSFHNNQLDSDISLNNGPSSASQKLSSSDCDIPSRAK